MLHIPSFTAITTPVKLLYVELSSALCNIQYKKCQTKLNYVTKICFLFLKNAYNLFTTWKKSVLILEIFGTYSLSCTEFKNVGIFAISHPVPKICDIYIFRVILTVHAYLRTYFCNDFTVQDLIVMFFLYLKFYFYLLKILWNGLNWR